MNAYEALIERWQDADLGSEELPRPRMAMGDGVGDLVDAYALDGSMDYSKQRSCIERVLLNAAADMVQRRQMVEATLYGYTARIDGAWRDGDNDEAERLEALAAEAKESFAEAEAAALAEIRRGAESAASRGLVGPALVGTVRESLANTFGRDESLMVSEEAARQAIVDNVAHRLKAGKGFSLSLDAESLAQIDRQLGAAYGGRGLGLRDRLRQGHNELSPREVALIGGAFSAVGAEEPNASTLVVLERVGEHLEAASTVRRINADGSTSAMHEPAAREPRSPAPDFSRTASAEPVKARSQEAARRREPQRAGEATAELLERLRPAEPEQGPVHEDPVDDGYEDPFAPVPGAGGAVHEQQAFDFGDEPEPVKAASTAPGRSAPRTGGIKLPGE